ncbi:MAG TPA: cytochrome c3 family protein [Burkholderiales bacterium]|nr:cytochrome c3 family protein [Burkholderiales bacterium]
MKIAKNMLVILALVAVGAFSASAIAVPPGMTVEFAGGPMGKVVFSGKIHADAGVKCNECHTKIFQMKKGADKITMAAIGEGKFCGTCHNGQRAFKANDPANCTKCHKK